MKPRFVAIALALWLASLAAQPARAAPDDQDQPRVAVIPVASINVTPDQADDLAQSMRQELGDALEVEVLDREQMQARLRGNVKDSCMSQPACVRDLGARLEVDQLLFLAIIRIGDRIQIDVTWGDARTGRTETREPVRVTRKDEHSEVFERAAARLLPGAAPRSPAADSVPPDSGPPPAMTNPAQPPAPAMSTPVAPVDHGADTGRRVTPGVWIAGGVAVAALIGGTTFGLKALGTENELETTCQVADPACPDREQRIDDLELQRDLADVMFVTAVAAGVTAGILYWRSGKRDTRVGVTATPSRTAVTFSTRF